MAELATIARPYAEALFRASSEQGADQKSVLAWVQELAMIVVDPQVVQLIGNPRVTAEQLRDLLISVMRSSVVPLAGNFLEVVIESGRLQALPEIAEQFRELIQRASGAVQATIYSAFPMNDAALAEIRPSLESRFGTKLHFTVKVDESLIGGIRVVVGDEVLDASVKASLEQMKAALIA